MPGHCGTSFVQRATCSNTLHEGGKKKSSDVNTKRFRTCPLRLTVINIAAGIPGPGWERDWAAARSEDSEREDEDHNLQVMRCIRSRSIPPMRKITYLTPTV